MDSKNIIRVIPDYASVEESALYVIESVEESFNLMMESIGIEELQGFEETGIIVNEAEASEKRFDKIIEWLKSIWYKIRDAFDKGLNVIKKVIDNNKNKLKNSIKEKCKKMAKNLKADKNYGEVFEWNGFENLIECKGPTWDALNSFDRYIKRINYAGPNDPEIVSKNKTQLHKVALDVEEAFKNSENVRGKRINVTKDYIVDNFEELWKYSTDYNNTAAKAKKAINEIKKSFIETEKVFKQAAKNKENDNSEIIKAVVTEVKKNKVLYVKCGNMVISAIRSRCLEATRIMIRLVIAVKQREEKEVKAESAMIESTTFQTELASLFNF